MSEHDHMTEGTCSKRRGEIYKELAVVREIRGGIKVLAWVAAICLCGILYHQNYRFSQLTEQIKEIKQAIKMPALAKKD